MSIDIALKVGVGMLGVSLASFGGYELHNYLTATLEKEFSLIPENDEKWDKLVQKYEQAPENSETGNLKKMEGLVISNESNKKQKLIDHCKSILKTSLRERSEILDKKKKEISMWCVSSATVLNS